MKHSEREHLKENELATVLSAASAAVSSHRSQYVAIGAGLLVVLLAVVGYTAWQRSSENAVSALLADAMVIYEAPIQPATPPGEASGAPAGQPPGTFPTERARLEAALPKFLAAADANPGSTPGRLARLNAAAVLVALGRFDEAKTHYEQLIGGSDLVARGAALGRAQAQVRAGQFEPAIEGLKTLSAQPTTDMPVDGILMELARAYKASGKVDDARKTLNEIVEKHAESPFAAEARTELDKMKS